MYKQRKWKCDVGEGTEGGEGVREKKGEEDNEAACFVCVLFLVRVEGLGDGSVIYEQKE